MIKIIIKIFSFYGLYIQPFLATYLIGFGLFTIHNIYTTEIVCIQNIETCTISALEVFIPGAYILIGVCFLTSWYYLDYIPYRNKKTEFKSSLKPEDFVK